MKLIKRKRFLATVFVILAVLLSVCALILIREYSAQRREVSQEQDREKREKIYRSFSETDRKTADLYAELYEMEREEVSEIQAETKDWEMTGKELEKRFFTIPENTKYQMSKDGYRIEDLEKAEELSVKTGRKALELAKAKGKAADNKKWSDVVRDSEILTTEEQLGLSKEQVKQLRERSLEKEDRVEIALLLLNHTYTFEEILKQLDKGRTIEELKKKEIK